MARVVNPSSEYIRERNLLVPGRKPVGPVKVDWSHPIGSSVIWYAPFLDEDTIFTNKGVDVGTIDTNNGSVFGPKRRGLARTNPAVSNYFAYPSVDVNQELTGATQATMFVDLVLIATTNSSFVFALAGNGSDYAGGLYFHYSTSSWICYLRTTSGISNTATGSSGPANTVGKRYFLCMTWDGATLTLYDNGKYVDDVVRGGEFYINALNLIHFNYAYGEKYAAEYYSAGILNRCLSASEVKSLCDDPYQFLVPA